MLRRFSSIAAFGLALPVVSNPAEAARVVIVNKHRHHGWYHGHDYGWYRHHHHHGATVVVR